MTIADSAKAATAVTRRSSHIGHQAITSGATGGYTNRRIASLDGLRGVAAIIVVCYHFLAAFLPSLSPEQTDHPFWLADTPLGILINGPFAVSVFFVLSGFVVAQAAAKRRDPVYVNLPLRYLRLAVPATASVIFAWCLLTLMPNAAANLNSVISHGWLSSTYQTQIPDLPTAFYEGLIGIFAAGGSLFNNALWTMRIELIGSFAIYVLYGLTDGRIRITLIALLGVVAATKPHYLGFVFGALTYELWFAGRLRAFCPILIFSIGILLGAPGHGFSERLGFRDLPHNLTFGNADGLIPPVAAALILYAVLTAPILDEALSSLIPRYLGRVSFPLYLVHVPLIYTVFSWVYGTLRPESALSFLFLFSSFIACSLGLALAGEVWIDGPVLACLSRLRSRLRGLRAPARSV
jgi:peptidoglycan/LPS O-acetylase OafA/YrhL